MKVHNEVTEALQEWFKVPARNLWNITPNAFKCRVTALERIGYV
jgi:hypothetical protein